MSLGAAFKIVSWLVMIVSAADTLLLKPKPNPFPVEMLGPRDSLSFAALIALSLYRLV